MAGGERAIRLSLATYERLLLLFPRSFRERHAESLLRTFEDLAIASWEAGGAHGLARFWCRIAGDLLAAAAAQHWASRAAPPTVDELPVPVVVCRESDGTILYANRACALALGASRAELVGRRSSEFTETPGVCSVAARTTAQEAPGQGYWVALRLADGAARRGVLAAAARPFGGQPALLACLMTPPEPKDGGAASWLESDAGRCFVRDFVHALRNPLFAVTATIDTLEPLPPDIRSEALDVLRRETGRLARLTDDLAHLSRPSGNRRWHAPIRQAIGAALHDLAALAGERGAMFDTDLAGGGVVEGDHDELRIAFRRILDNAVRATPQGANVRVAVQSTPGWVCVTIRDGGPGFSPRVLERLFEPFAAHRSGSSGLGLAVAHHILGDHGGRLDIATTEPGGVVEIWLPTTDGVGQGG